VDDVTAVEMPAVTFPTPPGNKWGREYRAFLAMLPELLKTHRGRYVAVHDGAVVADGTDKVAVARAAYARCGYVPMCVRLVTDEPPRVINIPSVRLLGPG